MPKSLSVSVIAACVFSLSCEPNEISFIIEHVKALPDPPTCSYSISDDFIPGMTVDLAFIPAVDNAFMVRNQLMSRENYDNLVAETNGILVEYYDIKVIRSSDNETVGGSQRIEYNYHIGPESQDLVIALSIPPAVSATLAEDFGCLPFNAGNYPESSMFRTNNRTDRRGNPVPRGLGTVYSKIQFSGHTQGGLKVESQEFTFPIYLCCGCTINWNNCDSECGRYCENAESAKVCTQGVVKGNNTYDCRYAYHNLGASWLPTSGDMTCEDSSGNPRSCTCSDCR